MVFFLSKKEIEIPEVLMKDPTAKKAYTELLNDLENALMLYIYDSGPYPPDEAQILPFHTLSNWAEKDWSLLYPKFEKKRWAIVYVSRGGFQLIDLIENKIDDFVWTYFKPTTEDVREFEDESIYEEYQDPAFEEKFADFMEDSVSILFIEDLISTGASLEAVVTYPLEVAEKYNVEVGAVACIALISRMRNLGEIPIYGVQTDIQIDLRCSWGNDLPDRIDARDFIEMKDYVDDR
jgi:hypothetical protein